MNDKTAGGGAVALNSLLGEPKPKKKRKQQRWERTYYNSYGNYGHYRFQDFRAQCGHRDDDHGGCNPSCMHADHPYATWDADYRECACDNCPLVEKDYDDEDPNEPDYSEGEQPILVLPPNAQVNAPLAPKEN